MARKENKLFRINGRVIDRKTKQGVGGLRVEAWDKDIIFNDLVGSAVTDDKGHFSIEFTQSYFRELFLDRRPDLFFKVFSGDRLIKSTKDSVLWNVEAGEKDITIEVDMAGEQPQPSKRFIVSTRGRPGVRSCFLNSVTWKAEDNNL